MDINLISLIIGICDIFIIIFCLKISKKIFPGKNIEHNEDKNECVLKKSSISCIYMIAGYILVKSVLISNWILYLNIVPSKGIFNEYLKQGNIITTIIVCIQVIVVGPIIEELIFRKLLLGKLLEKYNNKALKPILYSSLAFGIVHFNVLQGIVAFGGGIILGLIYYHTKSIKASIFAHILNNLLVIVPDPVGIIMNSIYLILGIYLIKKGNDRLKMCKC